MSPTTNIAKILCPQNLCILYLIPVLYCTLHLCVHTSFAGLLDAVSNFKSESLGKVIHLTWDAPFSLDITGVDPDIWYRVEFTVNGTHSLGKYSKTVNIPEFNFTMGDHNHTNTSVIYQFRVTPINGAGNGIASAPVTGYFGECELLM